MSLNRVKYSRILWHRRFLSRRDSSPLCRGSRSGKHLPARGFLGGDTVIMILYSKNREIFWSATSDFPLKFEVLLQIFIRFFTAKLHIIQWSCKQTGKEYTNPKVSMLWIIPCCLWIARRAHRPRRTRIKDTSPCDLQSRDACPCDLLILYPCGSTPARVLQYLGGSTSVLRREYRSTLGRVLV